MRRASCPQRGFTLVEVVAAIMVLAIVAGMVAVFIAKPAQGYRDSVARAELSDIADTALRRMARDVRLALPNSVRVSADGLTLEMLATRTGGRYLSTDDGADPSQPALDFMRASSTSFTLLGDTPAGKQAIAAGDRVVVFNLGPGFGPADAYTGGNSAPVTGFDGATRVVTLATNPFAAQDPPMPSPGSRFHVISGPVRYTCAPGANGTGTLVRRSGHAINATIDVPPAGGISALAATRVAGCRFAYDSLANTRTALVSMTIRLQDPRGSDGPLSLTHQVHVDNSP